MPDITVEIPAAVTPEQAYQLGYECGAIGATLKNCHFSIFATHENKEAWERGKADAEAEQP